MTRDDMFAEAGIEATLSAKSPEPRRGNAAGGILSAF